MTDHTTEQMAHLLHMLASQGVDCSRALQLHRECAALIDVWRAEDNARIPNTYPGEE